MKTTSRLMNIAIWLLLGAEMLFLLLPRTLLDLRAINFFLSLKEQSSLDGLYFGIGILLAMMLIEMYSLFALWWLALRCTSRTIDELPVFIGIGLALSVVSMLNFVLPIIWTLVTMPLFSTAGLMGKLRYASLIVIPTSFAIMYWRCGQLQRNKQAFGSAQTVDSVTHIDKPNEIWQYGLIAVVVAALAGYMFMQPASKPYLTLEEAAKSYQRVSVQGAPFDVPLTHTRGGGRVEGGGYYNTWEGPTPSESAVRERKKIDYIKVSALLPDMSPYTAENAAEFDKPGWGKRVDVLFGQEKNLDLSYIRRLVKMENSKLSGMLQYDGGSIFNDEFISQDYLISIRCSKEPPKEGWHPSCEVLRPYAYKKNIDNKDFPVYHLRYHFSAEYMQQWREIDEKVIALFDRFAEHAQQH